MKQCLKITAGVFLLVQTFHSASLQYSTDSPRPTINSSWLREQGKTNSGMQDAAVAGDDAESDQRADGAAVSTYDYSAGITSGSIDIYIEEGENVTSQDRNSNEGSDVSGDVTNTESPSDLRDKTEQPILSETNVSASTAAMDSQNSSQVNTTEVEEESNNSTATPPHSSTTSTTHLTAEKSTSALEDSNNTDSQATLAPEGTARPESTTKPADNTSLTDTTESIDAKETVPEIAEGSTSSPATVSRTAEMSPETTRSTAAQNTPEKANNTGKESTGGSSTDRGTVTLQFQVSQKTAVCDDHFVNRY